MKTLKKLLLPAILLLTITGCQEKITDRYLVNFPVYMERSEFKKSVKVTGSEDIAQPGKIYFKDHFIFINEVMKGIHVIDNTDPANPVALSFIEIPGNVDMAIKDSILFADSFIDLVALDISDISNIHEVGRVDSIFPYILPPINEDRQVPIGEIEPGKGIVVGWETREVEQKVVVQNINYRFFEKYDFMTDMTPRLNTTSGGEGAMSVGVGGSMARFTISGNFLYTVDQSNLKAFDIDQLSNPLLVSDQWLGWGVETVFIYRNKLFFGTQTGMIIYSLAEPSNPAYVSEYNHIRSCDPVVVEGDYAYVTLRAGNLCGEATSQLDIINISNILNPKWEQSYPMEEPYGLGIDNKTLFVCDGDAGLKVYNAANPKDIVKIAWFPEVNAFDVIPFNGLLMMIGRDGLYQYDYSEQAGITVLSFIPIISQGG